MKRIIKNSRFIVAILITGNVCGQNTASVSYSSSKRHRAEPEMVFVQGGTFYMGCTIEQNGDCYNSECPQHQVTVNSFYISKYEITQVQWEAIIGNNPSHFAKGDNYPVENVSWEDIQEFISILNAATGKNYRLPTEAEWEYAARGGDKTHRYKYSGSHNLSEVAWYGDNSKNTTHPVGIKMPNELGIYDMNGNVWEWCSDWYGDYSASKQQNPRGVYSGTYRVLRGGSFLTNARMCRVAHRDHGNPEEHYLSMGFRLVHP